MACSSCGGATATGQDATLELEGTGDGWPAVLSADTTPEAGEVAVASSSEELASSGASATVTVSTGTLVLLAALALGGLFLASTWGD